MYPALRILSAVILLLAGTAGAARADASVLFSLGAWRVFGGTMQNGLSVCGMSAYAGNGDTIHIKHFGRAASFLVQVVKPGWLLPPGQGIGITLRFDQAAPLNFRATGMGDTVNFNLAQDRIDWFLEDLRYARTLTVGMQDAGQPDWSDSVTGAGPAIGVFQKCMQASRQGRNPVPVPPGTLPPPADTGLPPRL